MNNNHIKTIQSFLNDQALDALLITSPSNITYASNFVARLSQEREAYVLVSKNNAYIFTSKLYLEEVKEQRACTPIELTAEYPLSKALLEIAEKEGLKKIGFEEENITYLEYKKLSKHLNSLIPTDLFFLREIKNVQEINAIENACEIGDTAFDYIVREITEGISEETLSLKLENFIRNTYASLSFPSIVAFGKNAAVPHHVTGKDILQKNQFVLLDFGVLYQNYCSDMTRTVFFGTPTQEEIDAYQTVKIAQEKAIEHIKSKALSVKGKENFDTTIVQGKDADTIARDYITSQGYPSFPHSLGHGIGLEVHESPSLSPYSKDILKPGMVFSVEPGIYVDHKLGIRIEDLIAITENEVKDLTHAPKELITL